MKKKYSTFLPVVYIRFDMEYVKDFICQLSALYRKRDTRAVFLDLGVGSWNPIVPFAINRYSILLSVAYIMICVQMELRISYIDL